MYLKLYNEGPGSVRVRSINVTAEVGNFGIDFSSGAYGVVNVSDCNCTIPSSTGVGMGGSGGNGFLNLPSGTTTSMMIVFNSGMNTYFEPGIVYSAMVVPVQAAEMPFTIPSEGGQ